MSSKQQQQQQQQQQQEQQQEQQKREADAYAVLESTWRLNSPLSRRLIILVVLFRLYNAFVISTSFVPDEYYQSMEVAHVLVFNYGFTTWEWHQKLRGFLHPLIFASLYKVLEVFGFDTANALILSPRLLQALFASLGDIYTFRLAGRFTGSIGASQWALVFSLLSWFNFFCGVRPLANSMEAVLSTIALYYWPWGCSLSDAFCHKRLLSLAICAFACALRPTSGILVIFLCFHGIYCHLRLGCDVVSVLRFIFKDVLTVAGFALLISACTDRVFYNEWTIVQWNFVMFNVFQGGSNFYGKHPWHWYFSQGFPVITTTFLPLFLVGVRQVSKQSKQRGTLGLFVYVLVTIIAYSLLAHKEFRFIFPVLAPVIVYSAYTMNSLWPLRQEIKEKQGKRSISRLGLFTLIILVFSNVSALLYLSLIHQRGTLDAMSHLRIEASRNILSGGEVHFWMPCHSTPHQSHLHRSDITIRFLECPPPLEPGDVDDADDFYSQPTEWLNSRYNISGSITDNIWPLPRRVVLFDKLIPQVDRFMQYFSFKPCASFFHAHILLSSRIGQHVVIYCRNDN